MLELPFWQLFAGITALVLAVVAAGGIFRLSILPTVVVVASLLGVPIVGLAIFALSPRPLGDVRVAYWALPFIGVAYALLIANFVLRLNRGRSTSFTALHRRVPLFLVAWPCTVAGLSVFLFLFEPELAVANVVFNALWFALWLPPGLRRFATASVYEIAAPRERVFAFISDPANWSSYNSGIESASVKPAGPLAVGSEITIRQRVTYPGLRGPRVLLPEMIEVRSVVTSLVANEMLATRRSDLPDSSDAVSLEELGGRTRVSTQARNVIAYRYAVLGARLGLARRRRRAEALLAERQETLRRLLEEPPAGP